MASLQNMQSTEKKGNENTKPDWSLLGLQGVSELPAIKWKQINLAKMTDDKHRLAVDKLKSVLAL